jgi:hypothetical protein
MALRCATAHRAYVTFTGLEWDISGSKPDRTKAISIRATKDFVMADHVGGKERRFAEVADVDTIKALWARIMSYRAVTSVAARLGC